LDLAAQGFRKAVTGLPVFSKNRSQFIGLYPENVVDQIQRPGIVAIEVQAGRKFLDEHGRPVQPRAFLEGAQVGPEAFRADDSILNLLQQPAEASLELRHSLFPLLIFSQRQMPRSFHDQFQGTLDFRHPVSPLRPATLSGRLIFTFRWNIA